MDLAHDALDAQLVDRDGRRMGRIDSIVLVVDDDGPPTVVAIECGPVALASRLHPRLASWLGRWLRRRGSILATPYRIPWPALTRIGNDFRLDVDATTTPAWAIERWIRDCVAGPIERRAGRD